MRHFVQIGKTKFVKSQLLSLLSISPASCRYSQDSTKFAPQSGNQKTLQTFKVKTFGSLKTTAGSFYNIDVKPVDPQKCPDQNIANISFIKSAALLKFEYADDVLNVTSENVEKELSGTCIDTCNIEVPIKFDVDIAAKKLCNVNVSTLDNDSVSVTTELGSCQLNKILTTSCTVQSAGGDIVSHGILQGNSILTTSGKGMIQVSKPLAPHFTATTSAGNIKIKSLYTDESRLSSDTGNIDIGSAHRAVHVVITKSGNLNIGSLDGSLTAEVNEGNVKVHVSRHSGVEISVRKGDISLSVPDTLTSKLHLSAAQISIDEQLNTERLMWSKQGDVVTGVFGGSEGDQSMKGLPTLRAHTGSGRLTLTQQDWFSALKLHTITE